MTELRSVSGLSEYVKDYHTKEIGYKNNALLLSAMYGGADRGRCIQITLNDSHIQLTVEQARQLRNELIRFCDSDY